MEEEGGRKACLVGGASVADVRRNSERERARLEAVDTQQAILQHRRFKGTDANWARRAEWDRG